MRVAVIGHPLWWAQHQLIGGWRRTFISVVLYTLIYMGALIGFRRVSPSLSQGAYIQSFLTWSSMANLALLFLGGISAIFRATIRDTQTKMIESHRQSPMSSAGVVLGYMIGSNMRTLALWTMGVILGFLLHLVEGFQSTSWFVGNGMAFWAGMCTWAAAAAIGLNLSKSTNPAGLMVFVLSMCAYVLVIIPGLGLATGFYSIVLSWFSMTGKLSAGRGINYDDENLLFVAIMSAHLLAGVCWFGAAMRKYRRPYRPAFDALHGTVFLICWLAIVFVGQHFYERASGMPNFQTMLTQDSIIKQLLAATGCSLIVAMVPISGCVAIRANHKRGGAIQERFDRIPSTVLATTAALLISLTLAMMVRSDLLPTVEEQIVITGWLGQPPISDAMRWPVIVLAMLSALLSCEAIAWIVHSRRGRIGVIMGLFAVVAWVIPFVVAIVISRLELGPSGSGVFHLKVLGASSPIGTMTCALTKWRGAVYAGLGIQWTVTAGLQFAAMLDRKRLTEAGKPDST